MLPFVQFLYKVWTRLDLVVDFCEYDNRVLFSINDLDFIDHLNDCKFLKKVSAS